MLTQLSENQLLLVLGSLALILLLARGAGELTRRVGLPEVLGEMTAGFVLGPSVLGALLPHAYRTVFLNAGVGFALSGLSWLGAILLLLVAGLGINLDVLRQQVRAAALTALLTILPALALGPIFASIFLLRVHTYGLYLGIVLSVTSAGVSARILLDQGTLRRTFGQVIVAAGIASEVIAWLLVSIVSSVHSQSPLLAGLRSAALIAGFFLLMFTVGRRFTYWAMRRVADRTSIHYGDLSVALILTLAAATLTQLLGLHALLGAFVFGMLLARAPRATTQLTDRIEILSTSIFSPIFFVLAGMHVNLAHLRLPGALLTIAVLYVAATAIKLLFGTLGARLGGLHGWQAAVVGAGMTMRGKTDIVIAILGVELGLLATSTYTMYAVVAIITVLLSPPLLTFLQRRAPPSRTERERLRQEEAERRSYFPRIEHVLLPVAPPFLPEIVAEVVERLAVVKERQREVFDITELQITVHRHSQRTAQVAATLGETAALSNVDLQTRNVPRDEAVETIIEVGRRHGLIALGARPPSPQGSLSLGRLQDQIIDRTETDVLVVVAPNQRLDLSGVKRILVPTNGLDYSMAAGDLAGALAAGLGAELCVLHMVQQPEAQSAGQNQQLKATSYPLVEELAFRLSRFEVPVDTIVTFGNNSGEVITTALAKGEFQLVVLGGMDRGSDNGLYLGSTVQQVLACGHTPAVLLVQHEMVGQAAG